MRVNYQIKIPQVRLIDEQGAQLGIVPTRSALEQAQDKNLDLVEIVPDSRPPVAKIMDYGKYQYMKKKQERKSRAKSKKQEVKGIRLRLKTDSHDLEVKRKKIIKFLNKGHKVSIDLMLRGREKMFFDKAREMIEEFVKGLEVPISFEQEITKTPNGFNTIIKNNAKGGDKIEVKNN